jgi:integrase/recombinase XerD
MPYQHKREPLTSDQITTLTSACRTPEEKLVIWTLLDTGLRISEFTAINRENLDFQTHRLTVMGKGRKRRIVPLTPRLRELLEAYVLAHDAISMEVRKAQRIVKRVATRAKIRKPVTPHVLRHTFAVQAVQKGVSLPTLMQMLGHSNLQTTQIYLNLAPEDAIKEFSSKW